MSTQKKQPQQKSNASNLALIGYQLFLGCLMVIITLSLATYHSADSSFIFSTTKNDPIKNWLGAFGAHCSGLLLFFFGCSAWLIPFILAYCLRIMLFGLTWRREIDRIATSALFVLIASTIASYYAFEPYAAIYPGGKFGAQLYGLLTHFLQEEHIPFFLFVIAWAALVIIVRFSFIMYLHPLAGLIQRVPVGQWLQQLQKKIYALLERNKSHTPSLEKSEFPSFDPHPIDQPTVPLENSTPETHIKPAVQESFNEDEEETELIPSEHGPYRLPPFTLFPLHKEQPLDKNVTSENDQQARVLEHKLERFTIKGKVVSITQGPAVTLFEYQPSIDTKISTILAREDDLALALQALSLRIIAPMPGRSVIGLEVAHTKRRPVLFSQALRSTAFASFNGALPLILGKDTLGHDVVIDLATMPHLLVAGSTGSGKSVGLHTMIMSLLCSKTPDEIKFILIDPKRLEFAAYSDIPHLIFPIVTDPRRAIAVLKWAVATMEDRYAVMAHAGVRNCTEFNNLFKPGDEEYLPLIVIIIDELADLMMTAGKDVETSIARLAQMARAAGIHLVAATQRPSVDVITGLIKVNFPSRIAYKVTSKVDSRTILDMMGAEKLLGKGDMLFLDGKGMVHRIHGAYVTDSEISNVVAYTKAQRAVVYKELTPLKNEDVDQESDEILQEVIQYIKNKDEISISLIQRVFRIGYNRSARIMEQLENYGYILPADGGKMRKVAKDS